MLWFPAVIISPERRGTVVCGHQNVEITVAIEVSVSQATPYPRFFEAAARFTSYIAKFSVSEIEKKLRRLRVADVPTDVSHGFVNVAIDNCQIQSAIQVDIEEQAAETEGVPGGRPDARKNGHVVENSGSACAIETDHFVVEVGDGDAGPAGIFEVSDINAHPGACFSLGTERQASSDRDILELAVPQIAVELVGLRVVGDEQVRPAVLVVVEHRHAQRF